MYCNRDHQKNHYSIHKTSCKPKEQPKQVDKLPEKQPEKLIQPLAEKQTEMPTETLERQIQAQLHEVPMKKDAKGNTVVDVDAVYKIYDKIIQENPSIFEQPADDLDLAKK